MAQCSVIICRNEFQARREDGTGFPRLARYYINSASVSGHSESEDRMIFDLKDKGVIPNS